MIVYQWVLVLTDLVHVILMTIKTVICAFLSALMPPPMKPIAGQTVLVS